jgi:hypothetical protein
MLTEEAVRERMWGPFPTLRRILESKPVPDRYHGPTSVSDTVFSQIERLLTMAILLHENRREVLQALQSQPSDESQKRSQSMLRQDLDQLHHALWRGATLFEAAMNDIEHELTITPQHHQARAKRDHRRGVFALALTLSAYGEQFGELPDSAMRRLFSMLNGFARQDDDEKALRTKANEWITQFGLPPRADWVSAIANAKTR